MKIQLKMRQVVDQDASLDRDYVFNSTQDLQEKLNQWFEDARKEEGRTLFQILSMTVQN